MVKQGNVPCRILSQCHVDPREIAKIGETGQMLDTQMGLPQSITMSYRLVKFTFHDLGLFESNSLIKKNMSAVAFLVEF
jgi:hypothetical protein